MTTSKTGTGGHGLRRPVELLAEGAILPYRAGYWLLMRSVGNAYAHANLSEIAANWAGTLGQTMRGALLRRMVAAMGPNVVVGMGSVLTNPRIELGKNVYIGRGCILGDARIGDDTLISDHVRIVSGQHGLATDSLLREQPEIYTTIHIGADCWIGSAATIMADVGDHGVVGAGSVVTRPVPDFVIVAGNPARPIGDRRERSARQK